MVLSLENSILKTSDVRAREKKKKKKEKESNATKKVFQRRYIKLKKSIEIKTDHACKKREIANHARRKKSCTMMN